MKSFTSNLNKLNHYVISHESTQASSAALRADNEGQAMGLAAARSGEEMWHGKYVTLLEK